jgi:hypothetical protein
MFHHLDQNSPETLPLPGQTSARVGMGQRQLIPFFPVGGSDDLETSPSPGQTSAQVEGGPKNVLSPGLIPRTTTLVWWCFTIWTKTALRPSPCLVRLVRRWGWVRRQSVPFFPVGGSDVLETSPSPGQTSAQVEGGPKNVLFPGLEPRTTTLGWRCFTIWTKAALRPSPCLVRLVRRRGWVKRQLVPFPSGGIGRS